MSCRSVLYDWLKTGKYDVDLEEEDEDDWGSKDGVRIMAIMYENDLNVAAYAVIINPEGEVINYLKLEHLLKRENSWNENDRVAKMGDMKLLRQVSIYSQQCRNFKIFLPVRIYVKLNWANFRRSKTAILTVLVALNLDICEEFTFENVRNC